MKDRDVRQELDQAIFATESFVRILEAQGHATWVARFSEITEYLRQGDIRSAKYTLRTCAGAGPGSLADIFDGTEFTRAWANCESSIRSLGEA